MTFWKKGDIVTTGFRYPEKGMVVSVEVSSEPYSKNAFDKKKTSPENPIEWVKVRWESGEEKEYACWDLRKYPKEGDINE